jgi:hypothetical protein
MPSITVKRGEDDISAGANNLLSSGFLDASLFVPSLHAKPEPPRGRQLGQLSETDEADDLPGCVDDGEECF